MLTADVTRSLPPAWQGEYSPERARRWIAERDAEGVTLLVVERDHDQAVGLMILGELDLDDDPAVEVRLGYLLAEWGWGKGLASELVGGFLDWCRHLPDPLRVIAGVAQSNAASARVLLGNGFVPVGTGDDAGSQTYEILIGARSER